MTTPLANRRKNGSRRNDNRREPDGVLNPVRCLLTALAIVMTVATWYLNIRAFPDAFKQGIGWALINWLALSVWSLADRALPFCRDLAHLSAIVAKSADDLANCLERIAERLFGANR